MADKDATSSTSDSASTPTDAASLSNPALQIAYKQECERLRKEMPTISDIPTCTNLLDTVFACHAVRNSIKSLYRYGERRPCGEKVEDFKFCMSTKWMEDEERYEAWIQRRAMWWAKRRVQEPSTEDVWEARECVLLIACFAQLSSHYSKRTPLQNYPPPLDATKATAGGMTML
jgi:hypothetical protein